MKRILPRRSLQVIASALALIDVGYLIHRSSTVDPVAIATLRIYNDFSRFDEDSESGTQISVVLKDGKWQTPKGQAIHLEKYHNVRSTAIRSAFRNAHPPVGEVPIFVKIGREASLVEFTTAIGLLRNSNICLAGFDELARIDASPPLPPRKVVTVFELCH